jgi:S-DNA-T family DNA segregation ATPase FtsK/SpoIIIE
MILHRLRVLGLDLPDGDLPGLADRLIADANDVSGDIVLRAAKRGESASELIGVVLSRRLLRDELGEGRDVGWYFLDDYAAWMGQREEQLADLLAISPYMTPDGVLRVTMAVTEAKYVELDSLSSKKKESQKQLRDTVRRISDALFGTAERLDRNSWLSRISDLILDGIRLPAASGIDLGEWRRAMREGRCEIDLRAASHVFIPTATDGPDVTDVTTIPDLPFAYQEVYGRVALKKLLLAYWSGTNTRELRRSLGADHLEATPGWRRPGNDVPLPPRNSSSGTTGLPHATIPEPLPKAGLPGVSDRMRPQPAPAQPTPDLPTRSAWAYPEIGELIAITDRSAEERDADQAWLGNVSTATKGALQHLNLQAKLIDASLTPNSALLRFAGSSKLTVEQVLKKRSELLTTFALNVISVRPNPGAVVLAVERPLRQLVTIQELWSGWHPDTSSWGNQDLLIAIRESDGTPLMLSPGRLHAPHTLVAGSTGSGKSVLMQNIILAIAATNTPQQARILLIDPKQGVDYFAFEGLPHLDGGIIDDQEIAVQRLTGTVLEMDRRYRLFKEARVPNLAAFNAKANVDERLPTIWIMHDEFAEWMLTESYKDEVSSVVQRLGVKARAAGIYLVFAAQRPDANVMPMQLRANLGNRLVLRVDSEGTSDIALGEKGAERLLGRGHLMAKLEGERDIIFAQVPFVEADFADAVVSTTL